MGISKRVATRESTLVDADTVRLDTDSLVFFIFFVLGSQLGYYRLLRGV